VHEPIETGASATRPSLQRGTPAHLVNIVVFAEAIDLTGTELLKRSGH
jgi:hypothetical protein